MLKVLPERGTRAATEDFEPALGERESGKLPQSPTRLLLWTDRVLDTRKMEK